MPCCEHNLLLCCQCKSARSIFSSVQLSTQTLAQLLKQRCMHISEQHGLATHAGQVWRGSDVVCMNVFLEGFLSGCKQEPRSRLDVIQNSNVSICGVKLCARLWKTVLKYTGVLICTLFQLCPSPFPRILSWATTADWISAMLRGLRKGTRLFTHSTQDFDM